LLQVSAGVLGLDEEDKDPVPAGPAVFPPGIEPLYSPEKVSQWPTWAILCCCIGALICQGLFVVFVLHLRRTKKRREAEIAARREAAAAAAAEEGKGASLGSVDTREAGLAKGGDIDDAEDGAKAPAADFDDSCKGGKHGGTITSAAV
jgi:hypothetical protein